MALRSIVLWGIVIAIQNVNLAVANDDYYKYCYVNGTNCGPETWPAPCQEKTGQSPINFPSTDPGFKNATKTTIILSKGCFQPQKFSLRNNFDQVVVQLRGDPCYMSGGLLKKRKVCPLIDIHWANGSEHTFNGSKRSLEGHINCYDPKYESYGKALKSGDKDAVTVISVHFYAYPKAYSNGSKPIVDCLKDIRRAGSSTECFGFNVSAFIDADDNYGLFQVTCYRGSLTFPWSGGCWNVYHCVKRYTTLMWEDWVGEFYKLLGKDEKPITKNTRDIQEFDGDIDYISAVLQREEENNKVPGSRPGVLRPIWPFVKPFSRS